MKDLTLDLARFTVLVGPNSAGKTSILQGADFVGSLWKDGSELFDPSGQVKWHENKRQFEGWLTDLSGDSFELAASAQSDACTLTIRASEARFEFVSREAGGIAGTLCPRPLERIRRRSRDGLPLWPEVPHSPEHNVEEYGRLSSLRWLSTVFLRIYPELASAPSYLETEQPRLRAGGWGLPSVLADLAASNPAVFERIREGLQRVVPRVRDVIMPRRQTHAVLPVEDEVRGEIKGRVSVMGHGLELEMEHVGRVDASEVSEGTIRTLAILTAIHSAPHAKHILVLIDDLDQALHPSAQVEMIGILRRLLENIPNLQILATTHSPYLLDEFEESEVRVCTPDAKGHTQVRSLAAHPDWNEWREHLKLGEFWASKGEDWVVQGGS